MATYFEGTTRRAVCNNVIGTGKRAYAGPQVKSNSMNPPAPKEAGRSNPTSATAAPWGGTGSNQSTAI